VSGSRLLLVEGVPGIGKSTLLDGALRRYVDAEAEGRLRTVVLLAQTHTYGPLAAGEDDGTLTREACLRHLERIVGWLEWLAESARGQPRPKCLVLVDTLHLTYCLRPGVVGWEDVAPFDRRLAAAGCALLLLDAEDSTVRERTVRARADTEFIRGYALGRFGCDEAELVEHFRGERDAFRRMFAASSMRKLRLAAEDPPGEAAASAAEFWIGGGGAWRGGR